MINSTTKDILHEASLLFNLAASTLVLSIGSTFAPSLITSKVGTSLGKTALSGLSLANVTANLLCLSLVNGLMSASDSLSPQAFGYGNRREVGLIAIRALFACAFIIVPAQIVTYFNIVGILSYLGQDETSIELAFEWYKIFLVSLPFTLIYTIAWKFLAAQEIMIPLVVVSAVSSFLILPMILDKLLSNMGFIGSSFANVIYQIVMAFTLMVYLMIAKPYYENTWPGLGAWREALSWEPFWTYLRLGLGGLLPIAEWWFWECIYLIAGTMGVVPLNVHTVAATVIQLGFQIPFGIGAALTIRLGNTLPNNVQKAKTLVIGCYIFTAFLMAIICSLIYAYRFKVYSLFTTDEDVIQGCEEIWIFVVLGFFAMSFFAMNLCVIFGLGLQLTGGSIIFGFLWCVSLPIVYIPAVVFDKGVTAIWKGLFHSYVLLDIVFFIYFSWIDWYEISERVKKDVGKKESLDISQPSVKYGAIDDQA